MNSLMFLGLYNWLGEKPEASKATEVAADKKALAFVKDSVSDNLFRRYNQTCPRDLRGKIKGVYEKLDAQFLFVLPS